MTFLLCFSLFMGLAVNRLKSQQFSPSAQLPGPVCLAGQALTEYLQGGQWPWPAAVFLRGQPSGEP